MYQLGEGVEQNYAKAYVWFSVAAAQGRADSASARDRIISQLSPQELDQAQAQATRCFESNYQDCD
jgi:TPR repeat protein